MCRLFGAHASAPDERLLRAARVRQLRPAPVRAARLRLGLRLLPRRAADRPRRFPVAAHADAGFHEATAAEGELIVVHVRRATVGGLKLENTHPFTRGRTPTATTARSSRRALLEPLADRPPAGDTDSERFFNLLIARLDPDDVIGTLRSDRRGGVRALQVLRAEPALLRRSPAVCVPLRRLRGLLAGAQRRPGHRHQDPLPPPHGRPHGEQVVLVASERLTDDEPWTALRAGRAAGLRSVPAGPPPPRAACSASAPRASSSSPSTRAR